VTGSDKFWPIFRCSKYTDKKYHKPATLIVIFNIVVTSRETKGAKAPRFYYHSIYRNVLQMRCLDNLNSSERLIFSIQAELVLLCQTKYNNKLKKCEFNLVVLDF